MPSLDDDFQQLAGRLRDPATLAAARSDPFYYFVYAPEETPEVRRRLPIWSASLRHAGLQVQRISFADLLWHLVDEAGHWDEWLRAEGDFDQEQINESIRDVLRRSGNGLVAKVAAIVERERPATIVFLTETEVLHPFFRVRLLESVLHHRVKVPTVVFYP